LPLTPNNRRSIKGYYYLQPVERRYLAQLQAKLKVGLTMIKVGPTIKVGLTS